MTSLSGPPLEQDDDAAQPGVRTGPPARALQGAASDGAPASAEPVDVPASVPEDQPIDPHELTPDHPIGFDEVDPLVNLSTADAPVRVGVEQGADKQPTLASEENGSGKEIPIGVEVAPTALAGGENMVPPDAAPSARIDSAEPAGEGPAEGELADARPPTPSEPSAGADSRVPVTAGGDPTAVPPEPFAIEATEVVTSFDPSEVEDQHAPLPEKATQTVSQEILATDDVVAESRELPTIASAHSVGPTDSAVPNLETSSVSGVLLIEVSRNLEHDHQAAVVAEPPDAASGQTPAIDGAAAAVEVDPSAATVVSDAPAIPVAVPAAEPISAVGVAAESVAPPPEAKPPSPKFEEASNDLDPTTEVMTPPVALDALREAAPTSPHPETDVALKRAPWAPPQPRRYRPAVASGTVATASAAISATERPSTPTLERGADVIPQRATVARTPAVEAPRRSLLRRIAIAVGALAVAYAALVLFLIVLYRFVDPPRSTVMLGAHLSGYSVDYRPVPITSISSYLQRAVITSEDARFCQHWGVDWGALLEAVQDARGGSTITMQTAKNLFLWPSRSYLRKAIEIPVALTIDLVWPKQRILEVYLNIAEWGPGIFGAEAAAWYHFDKPASRLTQHEATLLAASLPNPIAREAGDPGRITALLAARLRARMANSDAYVGCLGLRPMPRSAPAVQKAPKSTSKPIARPAAEPPSSWQTRTEPVRPPEPFNPWQN